MSAGPSALSSSLTSALGTDHVLRAPPKRAIGVSVPKTERRRGACSGSMGRALQRTGQPALDTGLGGRWRPDGTSKLVPASSAGSSPCVYWTPEQGVVLWLFEEFSPNCVPPSRPGTATLILRVPSRGCSLEDSCVPFLIQAVLSLGTSLFPQRAEQIPKGEAGSHLKLLLRHKECEEKQGEVHKVWISTTCSGLQTCCVF